MICLNSLEVLENENGTAVRLLTLAQVKMKRDFLSLSFREGPVTSLCHTSNPAPEVLMVTDGFPLEASATQTVPDTSHYLNLGALFILLRRIGGSRPDATQ